MVDAAVEPVVVEDVAVVVHMATTDGGYGCVWSCADAM